MYCCSCALGPEQSAYQRPVGVVFEEFLDGYTVCIQAGSNGEIEAVRVSAGFAVIDGITGDVCHISTN